MTWSKAFTALEVDDALNTNVIALHVQSQPREAWEHLADDDKDDVDGAEHNEDRCRTKSRRVYR